jgi:6-phosphogluconate dehydrogenase
VAVKPLLVEVILAAVNMKNALMWTVLPCSQERDPCSAIYIDIFCKAISGPKKNFAEAGDNEPSGSIKGCETTEWLHILCSLEW